VKHGLKHKVKKYSGMPRLDTTTEWNLLNVKEVKAESRERRKTVKITVFLPSVHCRVPGIERQVGRQWDDWGKCQAPGRVQEQNSKKKFS
jgi:hypothetical protein